MTTCLNEGKKNFYQILNVTYRTNVTSNLILLFALYATIVVVCTRFLYRNRRIVFWALPFNRLFLDLWFITYKLR